MKKRDENLDKFKNDERCQVLLGTIKAAGVGIDLRCAQNVYIMVSQRVLYWNRKGWKENLFKILKQEPNWNPAVEQQAVDCLYRMGQQNEVHVLKYFVSRSIEFSIYKIQRKKIELSMYVKFSLYKVAS